MMNHGPAKADEGLEGLNFMEKLRECLTCGVVAIDHQKKIVSFNPGAEELFQIKTSQALHHSVEVLPLPVREVIAQTLTQRTPQNRSISTVVGNRDQAIEVSTALLEGEQTGSFGVVAVFHDLTPARNLEQHLRHLDCLASIGTLSASMAHEIKNALVAVKTFLEMLTKQNKDAELADIVSREIRRIDSIVSQMLRFAGPAKPTFSTLHLHALLEHCLRLIEHQLADKTIRLKQSLTASPDLIKGDSYQLEQALLNLFFNAIEAMGPNGELSVATELVTDDSPSATARHAQLRLRITDNGAGIAPENIARLFEPFFTTKQKGSGLGLSITRRIIQEHSGTIHVESELNHGTTFTILLHCATK